MTYDGKKVWTEEDFDYSKAQAGDLVEQAVVDNAMDCLPPVCMTSCCSQMGEPWSTRLDENTGRYRSTFATFTRVAGEWPEGIWKYCGDCFAGEIEMRGKEPAYC